MRTDSARSTSIDRAAERPLVSVVVPFFDGESFIEECIESVLCQTYGSWELLLVDDGSSDGGSALARRYAQHYPDRIRYLEHPGHRNRGTSASRNLGMRHSRGQLIAFLDADDVWLPNKLTEQVALMERYPEAGLLYGRAEIWRSWTGDRGDAERDTITPLGVEAGALLQPPAFLQAMLTRTARAPDPSSVLVRREAAEAIGGWEEDFPSMYDDQAFVAKMNLKSAVLASNDCWFRYRQHPNSCYALAKTNGERGRARITYLRWLKHHLARERLKGSEVWHVAVHELEAQRGSALQRVRRYVTRITPGASSILRRGAGLLPTPLRRWMRARWRGERYVPPPAHVRFGSLRRLTPMSRRWGKDRSGQPIDRYYIERFLATHAEDVRGRVLEVQDACYTRRFGGERVTRSDVLHVVPGNPAATIVADLVSAPQIPADVFDCVILTQVLPFIEDVGSAVATTYRILRPGGTVLATVPGISQVARHDMEHWGDYWRFTTLSARRLFERVFPADSVQVESHGNVLVSSAFLYGLASNELRAAELDHDDPNYQLVITVRATKPRSLAEGLHDGGTTSRTTPMIE